MSQNQNQPTCMVCGSLMTTLSTPQIESILEYAGLPSRRLRQIRQNRFSLCTCDSCHRNGNPYDILVFPDGVQYRFVNRFVNTNGDSQWSASIRRLERCPRCGGELYPVDPQDARILLYDYTYGSVDASNIIPNEVAFYICRESSHEGHGAIADYAVFADGAIYEWTGDNWRRLTESTPSPRVEEATVAATQHCPVCHSTLTPIVQQSTMLFPENYRAQAANPEFMRFYRCDECSHLANTEHRCYVYAFGHDGSIWVFAENEFKLYRSPSSGQSTREVDLSEAIRLIARRLIRTRVINSDTRLYPVPDNEEQALAYIINHTYGVQALEVAYELFNVPNNAIGQIRPELNSRLYTEFKAMLNRLGVNRADNTSHCISVNQQQMSSTHADST